MAATCTIPVPGEPGAVCDIIGYGRCGSCGRVFCRTHAAGAWNGGVRDNYCLPCDQTTQASQETARVTAARDLRDRYDAALAALTQFDMAPLLQPRSTTGWRRTLFGNNKAYPVPLEPAIPLGRVCYDDPPGDSYNSTSSEIGVTQRGQLVHLKHDGAAPGYGRWTDGRSVIVDALEAAVATLTDTGADS